MGKIHSNSLYAKLQRAGLLDDFFAWVYAQAPGYTDVAKWLEERGMPHSDGAIHTLLRVHSIYWKVEAASRQAAATDAALPEQTDALIRRQLKEKEFDLAFSELSTAEKLSLLRFDMERRSAEFRAELEREKLALKREAEARAQESLKLEREKFEATERRLAATRDAVKRLNESGGLTPEARAEIEKAMGVL